MCIVGVQLNRLLEVLDTFFGRRPASFIQQLATLEISMVGIGALIIVFSQMLP